MNRKAIIFWAIILLLLILNSLHATYPDEFDNLLGGKLLLAGILPYRDYFSHHGILSYLISASILPFSGISFVHFRLLFAGALTGLAITSFVTIRKAIPKEGLIWIAGFLILLAVSATYFWGNMLLADTLSSYFLIPAYLLLFWKFFRGNQLKTGDLITISVFTFLAVLNSPTYLYAVAVFIVAAFWYQMQFVKRPWLSKINLQGLVLFGIIFAVPYVGFIIYLLLTKSWSSFYFDEIVYNRNYYIYNYPRPAWSTSFNPVRYAVVIVNDFVNATQTALVSIKTIDLRYPLTGTFAFVNLSLVAFLLVKKKFLLVLTIVMTLAFVNARGNPADIKATDYQTAAYFVLTLANGALLGYLFTNFLDKISNYFIRSVITTFGVIVVFLGIFSVIFLGGEWWRLNYNHYMGTAPLIYDRPAVAPLVNSLVPTDQYCWVGPFAFEDMFYLQCKLPSTYTWILPQLAGIPSVRDQIISDFSKNKPQVIVFHRNFFVFGQGPKYLTFFDDFLNRNYVLLNQIPGYTNYVFTSEKMGDFTPDSDVNFRRDLAGKFAAELLAEGEIEPN